MKRCAVLLICLVMLSVSVTSFAADSNSGPVYKPGTYLGKGFGMFGDVVLAVTFSYNEITDIRVLENHETVKVTAPAFRIMPERIINAQSLMVDIVSSATFASKAIISATEDAAKKASKDISALKKPLTINPDSDLLINADVLVIGAGGAGLAAATSAAQGGAKVVILEKNEWAGGNTVVCGGVWNAFDPELTSITPTKKGQLDTLKSFLDYNPDDYGDAAETVRTLQIQIAEYLAGDTTNMFDSKELHAIQTYVGSSREDLDGNPIIGDFSLIKTLTDNSLETRKWVESIGGEFFKVLSEPSGALWTRAVRPDVSTNPFGQIDTYVTVLEKVVLENDGQLIYDTRATELIVEDGMVKGAIGFAGNGTKVEVRAEATVLACGGYASNIGMVKEYDNYWGEFGEKIFFTTLPSTVGDGILMAQAANAQLVGMEVAQLNKGYATTGLHAAEGGLNSIWVNKEGRRFVNEYAERDVYSKAAMEQGGQYFCIRSEKNLADKNGVYDTFIFDTVEEMALHFDMDPNVLKESIDKYNSYIDLGNDPEFHKNVLGDKVEAPYAISAWVPIIHHTMGGVKINTKTQVLDLNDNPIPGLYAAGEVTGGIHGGNRLGGNAVADAFVFGRIAGQNAAVYATE